MTRVFTFEELVAEVPGLSSGRMTRYLAAGIVRPVHNIAGGESFRAVDRARLMLACELADQFALEDEALSLVLDLVDQMHGFRKDLRRLMRAVEAQPEDIRRRIGEALALARG